MSGQTPTVTGVVEQMLGHAARGRWGGAQWIGELFELAFEPGGVPGEQLLAISWV